MFTGKYGVRYVPALVRDRENGAVCCEFGHGELKPGLPTNFYSKKIGGVPYTRTGALCPTRRHPGIQRIHELKEELSH
jgi:hypothetical protein